LDTSISTSVKRPAPDEFHPFPKLPIEMRLKIWKLEISMEPRIAEVKFVSDVHGEEHQLKMKANIPVCSTASPASHRTMLTRTVVLRLFYMSARRPELRL
jgi:hypothetical protein